MKLRLYSILLFGVVLSVACNEKILDTTIPEDIPTTVITAHIDENLATKASITSRGEFYWNSGDVIDVYTTSKQFKPFQIISGAGTLTAEFSGELQDDEIVSSVAVYPASLSPTFNNDELAITLPSEYELEDNNLFCNMPMIAEIQNDGSATFKHLGGILRFTLRCVPAGAETLLISADNRLSGSFKIVDNKTCTERTSQSNEVKINLGKFHNTRDITINVPIPTGNYDKISLSILNESEEVLYEKESSKSRVISEGELYIFSSIEISHPFIDLGLPSGTLWAEYNVGATKSTGYGDYFAYGETSTKSRYYLDNYELYNRTFIDNACVGYNFDLNRDAAFVNWGSDWRTPTSNEWQELIDNCTHLDMVIDGIRGLLFTGPNGNEIFFPYAGYFFQDEVSLSGSWLKYLTSTIQESSTNITFIQCAIAKVYISRYSYDTPQIVSSPLYFGYPVRAVSNKPKTDYLISSITLEKNNTTTLSVINPSGTVTWSSSNSNIATVDSNGLITGHSGGKAHITATIGSVKRTCEVTVVTKPDVFIIATRIYGSFLDGSLLSGGRITFTMTNYSSDVVNVISGQVRDPNSVLCDNRNNINTTLYPGESKDFDITIGSKFPLTSKGHFRVEYNGYTFEYIANIR